MRRLRGCAAARLSDAGAPAAALRCTPPGGTSARKGERSSQTRGGGGGGGNGDDGRVGGSYGDARATGGGPALQKKRPSYTDAAQASTWLLPLPPARSSAPLPFKPPLAFEPRRGVRRPLPLKRVDVAVHELALPCCAFDELAHEPLLQAPAYLRAQRVCHTGLLGRCGWLMRWSACWRVRSPLASRHGCVGSRAQWCRCWEERHQHSPGARILGETCGPLRLGAARGVQRAFCATCRVCVAG